MALANAANLARQDLADAVRRDVGNAAAWQSIWSKQQSYMLDQFDPEEAHKPAVNARMLIQMAASAGRADIANQVRSWVARPENAGLWCEGQPAHLYSASDDQAFHATSLGPTHYFSERAQSEGGLNPSMSVREQGAVIRIHHFHYGPDGTQQESAIVTVWGWDGALQQRKVLPGDDSDRHWNTLLGQARERLGQRVDPLEPDTGDWAATLPESGSTVHVDNRRSGEHREYRFQLPNKYGVYRDRFLALSNSLNVMSIRDLESDTLLFKGLSEPGFDWFLPGPHAAAILQRRRLTLLDLADSSRPVIELSHSGPVQHVILKNESVVTVGGMELIERPESGHSRSVEFLDPIKVCRFDGRNLAVVDESGGLTFVSLADMGVIRAYEIFEADMPEANFSDFVFTGEGRGIAVDFWRMAVEAGLREADHRARQPLNASLSRNC
jgi:hypothetical protein